MLERRPDLRAAKARVVAADYRVAAAIAARLPSLTLSGSVGLSSPSLSGFFESVVWNIVGSVSGTIWDGGRLSAEIDRNEAVLDERVAVYAQALLTALVEVESALVQEKQARARIDILGAQVRTARATLEAARSRFGAGVGSYLATLTALRSLQQAEQSLLGAKRQLLSARVQVYRALGSRWTVDLIHEKTQPKEEPS
jgi:outer membrane protein TolC